MNNSQSWQATQNPLHTGYNEIVQEKKKKNQIHLNQIKIFWYLMLKFFLWRGPSKNYLTNVILKMKVKAGYYLQNM